jgi:prepilin-type N-terminal cleavage/methylation domain-containing protein
MKSIPIKSSVARLRVGFTLIELLVVIGIIAILASLAFPVTQSVLQRAYKLKAQATVQDLQVAINNYITEYNRLPMQGTAETPIQTNQSTPLIGVLIGEVSGPNSLNPRGIQFLTANMAKNGVGGLVDNGGSALSLVDNWGNPYFVLMDGNYDNKVANPDVQNQDRTVSGNAPPQLRTRVAVFSLGPDKQQGTRDDIVSWR